MSKDAFTPRTTDQRLPLPLNGTIYTTTRLVAPEKTTPEVGSTMASELGAAWADSTIISVMVQPQNSQEVLVIQHARIPSETAQLASNWEQVEVPIGGKSYPGVMRTVILPAASYQDDTPAIGSAMPVIAAGLFAGDGYTLFERNSSKIGSPLEPVFRIDRRTFIIPRAFSGEEYGDIVTKSVEETIVSEATAGDTGINIISSVVDPIGKGLAIKNTKSAKGGWPDPVEEEIVLDGTHQPPARYLRGLTRRTVTTKTGAVPGSISLAGDEVSKVYKRETPDRVDGKITTEDLNLNITAIDESVSQKPYVKITEVMTPGPTKVVPVNRNGSAKMVYENGVEQIWENVEEVAEARPGPAGSDKDTKPFVTILTDKRYATDNTINTTSGGANIIFNDGTTQIYEISEVTSTGRYGDAGTEQQVKPFVKITSEKDYTPTGILPSNTVGSSNKVYDDGQTVVYEQSVETAEVREGPAGSDKDTKPFVSIETAKRYSADSTINTTSGSANVVFNDGAVQVYEISEPTATVKESTAGTEKEEKPFVRIATAKRYSGSSTINTPSGASRLVFDDGTVQAYEISEPTATAKENDAGTEKDEKPFASIETTKRYSTSPVVNTLTGSSRLIYDDGALQVYEISEVGSVGKNRIVGDQLRGEEWGLLTSQVEYAATSNLGGYTGNTRIAYDDGNTVVYENTKDISATPGATFTSFKEEKPVYTKEIVTSFQTTNVGTGNYQSRRVFSNGTTDIYRIDTTTVTGKAAFEYPTIVQAATPSVLTSVTILNCPRKDGGIDILATPYITEGYRGSFPGRVVEYYTETAPAAATGIVLFRPSPILVNGLRMNFTIQETLHGEFDFYENVDGDYDPIWETQNLWWNVGATEPPDIPYGEVLHAQIVEPFENGFLVKEIYVTYRTA